MSTHVSADIRTWDFSKDFNCKLAWKIDWPMRWMIEGVDFEPGGKDHASQEEVTIQVRLLLRRFSEHRLLCSRDTSL